MNFISSLINPLQNCEYVAVQICKLLKVPITKNTLVNATLEHPDYPSLLAMSDVLSGFGVENISAQVDLAEDLVQLNTPFVVQVFDPKTKLIMFATVFHLDNQQVEWEEPISRKNEKLPFNQFKEYYRGYVQVYEKSEKAGEKDYTINAKKEKNADIVNTVLISTIPLITLISGIVSIFNYGINAVLPVLYTLLLLIGSAIGGLLILFEVNEYNPALNKVCLGGEKTNCAAILSSKGARIFGISWSIIGFSYFLGVLVILLSGGIVNLQLVSTAAWLNVLVLPYVVYSIYYQVRIVKQWCPLCLTVQGILLLLLVTSIIGGFLSLKNVSINSVVSIGIGIIVIFLAAYLLLSALVRAKSSKNHLHSLQSLKHNPKVFDVLFKDSREITQPVEELGITLGNPDGKIHLIKVCNPYCKPCAKAHPILENLLFNNPEIKLQVIFMVTESDIDWRNKPVKTFLSLNQETDKKHVLKSLDIWYNDMDYNKLTESYRIEQDKLDTHITAIKKMREWCTDTKIEYTPTYFINGHQLPRTYSVRDIRYLLAV